MANSNKNIIAIYDYTDENGKLLYQNCRLAPTETKPKPFLQRRPDENGGYTWSLEGVNRTLYRVPELLKSSKQDWCFVCEGEKDTDRLNEMGLTATTSGSSTSWKPEFRRHFQGRLVCVLPDNDIAGEQYSRKVADSLCEVAAEVRILNLPGLGEGDDVSDWLDMGGTSQELMELVDRTEPYQSNKENSSIKLTSARFNLTDTGNAERLAVRQSNRLRYVYQWDRWIYYDGRRWNTELGSEMAQRLAVETVRNIVHEAQSEPDEVRRALVDWSIKSESTHRINAMLTAAKAIEGLSAYPKDFDTDMMLFNVLNGTIDLRTGELHSHNSADMITMISPVTYCHDSKLKLWDKFLDTATDGGIELQDFLQKAVGHSLTGDTGLEKLYFIHGPGATGKTTFVEAVKSVLGDYATTADFESFLRRPPQSGILRNDIASLAGKRFVASIEVDEGRRLAEGLIKMLTGGDKVRARFLYHESFEFVPQFKLWLVANHEPKLSDDDDAIWRRIVKIPFIHEIPKAKRDPFIKLILRNPKKAGSAILAWAVEGCLKWQKEGLRIPEIIEDATERYREAQDPLQDFYDELLFDPDAYVPVNGLRIAYEHYAKDNGIKFTLMPQKFNKRLEARGCKRKPMRIANAIGTIKPVKCWTGVTLASNPTKQEPEMIEDEIPF